MDAAGFREFYRRWGGTGAAPRRRAIGGGVIVVIGFALSILVAEIFPSSDIGGLIMALTPFVAGLWARTWLVVPVVWVAFAVTGILLDVGSALVMGADWWERRNAEHWPGDDPIALKLLLQSFEYVVFGALFAVEAAVGVLIGKGVAQLRRARGGRAAEV